MLCITGPEILRYKGNVLSLRDKVLVAGGGGGGGGAAELASVKGARSFPDAQQS